MANQSWNDWEFQIHWNKLEWVNPRIFIEINNPFCVPFKNSFERYELKCTLGWSLQIKNPGFRGVL